MLVRRYFVRADSKHAVSYPEDIKKIREHLTTIGTLDATDTELDTLYSTFSEDCFSAGWLTVSEDILERFAEWLEEIEVPQ